jgi:branched-chain amino acid transport system ATP-binding protein
VLAVEELRVRYGPIAAVRGVSLELRAGEIVTIVGPNGAGKSSTLLAIAGALEHAAVSGSVRLDGIELLGRPPERIAAAGVGLVPEGRRIFHTLTVRENLLVAVSACRDRAVAAAEMDRLLARLPALSDCLDRPAGLLSGGQQQQLALARALVRRPRVLLLDEPSLGLAPLVIDEVFVIVEELRAAGIAVLLLEQNAIHAAEIADHVLVLRDGKVEALDGVEDGRDVVARYFGLDSERVVL